ncbi:hypothetical protein ACWC24_40540 [Streptomyces sp. NPDC001443]
MTDRPTQLKRLRLRLLSTAYCNADFWTQRTAFLTDQAVSALARRDPAEAETLAERLLAPEVLHDMQILGAAVEAGIDTSTWEQRRESVQRYAREADQLPLHFDPATEAHRLWASLLGHYPLIAAALAEYLNDLPDTWREDLFTTSENSRVRQAPKELPGPETAPYDPTSWEDCEACAEAQDQCRFHKGVFAGMEYQADLIKTALTDAATVEYLQERHAEVERRSAQPTDAAAAT